MADLRPQLVGREVVPHPNCVDLCEPIVRAANLGRSLGPVSRPTTLISRAAARKTPNPDAMEGSRGGGINPIAMRLRHGPRLGDRRGMG
jgi:hypothetical protein